MRPARLPVRSGRLTRAFSPRLQEGAPLVARPWNGGWPRTFRKIVVDPRLARAPETSARSPLIVSQRARRPACRERSSSAQMCRRCRFTVARLRPVPAATSSMLLSCSNSTANWLAAGVMPPHPGIPPQQPSNAARHHHAGGGEKTRWDRPTIQRPYVDLDSKAGVARAIGCQLPTSRPRTAGRFTKNFRKFLAKPPLSGGRQTSRAPIALRRARGVNDN